MMSELARFLAAEVERTSLREVEAKTGVSKTAIDNLIKQRNANLPEIETLQKLAKAYQFPLWRVVEMAGIDLELPQSPSERSQRLAMLAAQQPPLQALVDRLLELYPSHPDYVDGMLLWLETAVLHRSRQQQSGEQQETV